MMVRALRAEFLKLKRSRMPLWTALIVLASSVMSATAVFPSMTDPKSRGQVAAFGATSRRALEAGLYDRTWTAALKMGVQFLSGDWGLLTFGLAAAYLFAREFSEGTVRTTFTSPVRREHVIVSKFVVLAAWVAALGLLSVIVTIAMTAAIGPEGFAWRHVALFARETAAVVALLYFTLPVAALLAMRSRGYMQPMLFSLVITLLGFAVVDTAASPWLPWYMPVHVAGTTYCALPQHTLGPGSWVVAVGFFLAGAAACVWKIDHTDDLG